MTQRGVERVRIGVVGTSWWAETLHLPVLSTCPRAQVAAICGRNRKRGEEMAAKYAIPRVYSDYRQMITEAGLQALVVITPDDTHYEIGMAALDAGLHLLCEKPVSLRADHARAMYEKAESAAVKTQVFFTWRWMPQFRYLKELVKDGYVGRPSHADLRFIAGYGRRGREARRADRGWDRGIITGLEARVLAMARRFVGGGSRGRYMWRFDGDRSNGIIGDLGSHLFDMARWYMGEIRGLSARVGTYGQYPGPDGRAMKNPANDSGAALLDFENGAHGTVQVSVVAETGTDGPVIEVSIHGEEGSLRARAARGHAPRIQGVRNPTDAFTEIPIPAALLRHHDPADLAALFRGDETVGQRLFIDGILDGKAVEPNLYDGYKAQQVIDAALESHRTGRRVVLA